MSKFRLIRLFTLFQIHQKVQVKGGGVGGKKRKKKQKPFRIVLPQQVALISSAITAPERDMEHHDPIYCSA